MPEYRAEMPRQRTHHVLCGCLWRHPLVSGSCRLVNLSMRRNGRRSSGRLATALATHLAPCSRVAFTLRPHPRHQRPRAIPAGIVPAGNCRGAAWHLSGEARIHLQLPAPRLNTRLRPPFACSPIGEPLAPAIRQACFRWKELCLPAASHRARAVPHRHAPKSSGIPPIPAAAPFKAAADVRWLLPPGRIQPACATGA